MTTIGPVQSPKAPQSASAVRNQLRIEEKGAELLELRTEAGVVYVCPSRLQRIRLRWAFRHFHVLPPQVLSRRNQRLIEKLSRSGVVTPTLPASNDTVLGVIEKIRSKAPALAAAMATQGTEQAATEAFPTKRETVGVKQRESSEASGGQKAVNVRLRQWGAWSTVAAVCITVFLVLAYRVPLSYGTRQHPRTVSTPIKDAVYDRKPLRLHSAATGTLRFSSETTSVPSAEKPQRWVAPRQSKPDDQGPVPVASRSGQSIRASIAGRTVPALAMVPDTSRDTSLEASARPASIVASAATKPPFVSELPQGHVVYPRVSGRNLVGELQLKALIGTDGSVKEVTVLSGSTKLAEAGVRAVRRWHYHPYQVLGAPVEVETRIKISFFGPDAVSVASVADEASSKLN